MFFSSNISDVTPYVIDHTWISATETRNFILKDPLLDWLKHHHQNKTTTANKHKKIHKAIIRSTEDTSYNFTKFIMEQGHIFEKKVMDHLFQKYGAEQVLDIGGELDCKNPALVERTLKAMKDGIPFIHSGILHNQRNKTFGIPDLLVRSDWLNKLVSDDVLMPVFEKIPAPLLNNNYHYRVVDIKFTTLMLKADHKHLLNTGMFPAYKSQLYIYNEALGILQGYTPTETYVLGRRWKYTSKGETYNGDNCFTKLGVIDYGHHDRQYPLLTAQAIDWLRDCKSPEAASWNVLNYPLDRKELYPNMSNSYDYPWHNVKQKIAKYTKELTSVWMVGPKERSIGIEHNIYQWTDPQCNSNALGICGPKKSKIIDLMLDINRGRIEDMMYPKYIENNIGGWKDDRLIEFFVDFETINGSTNNIDNITSADSATIIFMIGVGYINPDHMTWVYKDFTVHKLDVEEERRICSEFSKYVLDISNEFGMDDIKCYHWGSAERIIWADTVDRHFPISNTWTSLTWVDLLTVFKEEPIVIKGSLSYGLKSIANAMKDHGYINTVWNVSGSCVDGQGAMVVAQHTHQLSQKRNVSMTSIPIMKEVVGYNEVDTKVLYEILTYLRLHCIRFIDDHQQPRSKREHKEIEVDDIHQTQRTTKTRHNDIYEPHPNDYQKKRRTTKTRHDDIDEPHPNDYQKKRRTTKTRHDDIDDPCLHLREADIESYYNHRTPPKNDEAET